MSRLKVWNADVGEWQYVGGQQPVLRYVPLNPHLSMAADYGMTNSTAANLGPSHTPSITGIPTHAVAVSALLYASHSAVSSGHRFNAFAYDAGLAGLNMRAQMMSGKVASHYETVIGPYIELGGDRQFDYQVVIGSAGTTSFNIYITGYWTYQAPSASYPIIGAYGYGDTFPVSPTDKDRFWRTDLNMEFFWNAGTSQWLSVTLYEQDMHWRTAENYTATTLSAWRWSFPNLTAQGIRIESIYCPYFISGGTALSGSHKWDVTFYLTALEGAASTATIQTLTISSGALNQYHRQTLTVNATYDLDTYVNIDCDATKTGTPGGLFLWPVVTYRVVAT